MSFAQKLAELADLGQRVAARFDARAEIMRASLEDLQPPMRVNLVLRLVKELFSKEEVADLQRRLSDVSRAIAAKVDQ